MRFWVTRLYSYSTSTFIGVAFRLTVTTSRFPGRYLSLSLGYSIAVFRDIDWKREYLTWTPSPCTREWKMCTRVHLTRVNLLSVFTCFTQVFANICLGDSLLQCDACHFADCTYQMNWLLLYILYMYILLLK